MVADNAWFEGRNSPGAGDLGQMQALQQNLASVADAARQARQDLSGLKDHVSDAVWRGRSAEEFKSSIDQDFLGQLGQLDASYQDAADGFGTYIAAVSDIKNRADGLARSIYTAQSEYESAASALQNWLFANPDYASYSHGSVTAPSPGDSAYTVGFHGTAAAVGGQPDANAAAAAANAQTTHATLQGEVDRAWSTLQGLYQRMDGLKTHDRVAADNAVSGSLNRAHHAGIQNESGWHAFFHFLSTVAQWAAVVLVVVAVVAAIVLLPGLGLMGAIAALTAVGESTLAATLVYGGAIASAVVLTGDLGQKATGDGPGWGKIALDVLGIVPGLGKAGSLIAEFGGTAARAVAGVDDAIVTAKLSTVINVEKLYSNIEYTPLGIKFAGIVGAGEKGLKLAGNAILGYGEVHPVESKFGAALWSLSKVNGLWGGASNIFPAVSKTSLEHAGISEAKSLRDDVSPFEAQAQIAQYRSTQPVSAAKAHDIAKNLAAGIKAKASFPGQYRYPQAAGAS